MSLNLTDEINKLVAKVNDPKLTFEDCINFCYSSEITFDKYDLLIIILNFTFSYPVLEENLEELLQEFTVDELFLGYNMEKDKYFDIIIYVGDNLMNISLNAIKILVQKGLNFSQKIYEGNTFFHLLTFCFNSFCEQEDQHIFNVMQFFTGLGIDLNEINDNGDTVLDRVINNTNLHLTPITKKFIELLIDHGANITDESKKISIPKEINNDALEFINSHKCLNIKCAIKK